MTTLRRLIAGLRTLLWKRHHEQDLDDELRAYLEAAVEQNMAAGMSREEALRAARISLGSLEATKDAVRDVGWESRLESVWQDVRYAFRGLRRSPGFAAVAILTLALGIGVNTAIFSVVNSLLLRALPVTAPEQLALLSTREAIEQGYVSGWNYGIWDQIHQRQGRLRRRRRVDGVSSALRSLAEWRAAASRRAVRQRELLRRARHSVSGRPRLHSNRGWRSVQPMAESP